MRFVNLLDRILGSVENYQESVNETFDDNITAIDEIENVVDEVENIIDRNDIGSEIDAVANDLIKENPDFFTEKNIVRFDRTTILNQLVGICSIILAKRRNDPLAAAYAKNKKLGRTLKQRIMKKYSAPATNAARKLIKRRKFKI